MTMGEWHNTYSNPNLTNANPNPSQLTRDVTASRPHCPWGQTFFFGLQHLASFNITVTNPDRTNPNLNPNL